MQAFIYRLTMMRSKRYIQKTYGKSFWKQFQALSDPVFHQVSKELPDIGDSIFSLIDCQVKCNTIREKIFEAPRRESGN